MGFLTSVRAKLHGYYLRKKLQNYKATHYSMDLGSAKSVGLLLDATDLAGREVVLKFSDKLKKEGKEVKLLAFFGGDAKAANFVFPHFTKKDLDFALRPKTAELKKFMEKPFDILINLTPHGSLPLEYIAAFSKARFRVGPSTDKTYCYELMIDTVAKKDLQSFLQQVTFFINKMNTTHESSTT
ncbi:MAG: hypothetical protein ACI9XO_003900 [Paraglaciecola sp.]|jgi:hypothetical protein